MLTQEDMEKLITWANTNPTGPKANAAHSDALSVAYNLRDNIELAKKDIARPEVAKIIKELDNQLAVELFEDWWKTVLHETKSPHPNFEGLLKLLAKSAFCAALSIGQRLNHG